jgi:hypothetical protein
VGLIAPYLTGVADRTTLHRALNARICFRSAVIRRSHERNLGAVIEFKERAGLRRYGATAVIACGVVAIRLW